MTTQPKIRHVPSPIIDQANLHLDYRLNIKGWGFKVHRMPNPNCKNSGCYGRGWIGRDSITSQPMLCKCVGRWELIHEPEDGGTEDEPSEHNTQ